MNELKNGDKCYASNVSTDAALEFKKECGISGFCLECPHAIVEYLSGDNVWTTINKNYQDTKKLVGDTPMRIIKK